MNSGLVLVILFFYFGVLLLIAHFTGKQSHSKDFFVANKQAPWYLVAFGMIGSSLSGVTFISIPGAVYNPKNPALSSQFSYFQVVLGYLLGYWVIGTILMPLYYRLNLISIYTYLEQRLGFWSYKIGAFFFLLSRTIGASLRIFLAASVLQLALFDAWNIPFEITAVVSIFLIWVYTYKGGIKTIIWTDTLQTAFLVTALLSSIWLIKNELNLSFVGLVNAIVDSPYSRIFFFEDWNDNRYFFKQFFAGTFIAIAMTGLDQDLMQKNLSCKNIHEAQKNMFWFCVVLVFVNILFLSLGASLYLYATHKDIPLPAQTDKLYPMLAFQHFGILASVAFLLGITAATYASADAALASLTTSFCIDFLNISQKTEAQKQKAIRWVHVGFSVILVVVMLIFKQINNDNVINSLFKIAGYTYGPLLGLYAFGLFTRWQVHDRFVPLVCIISPWFCWILQANSEVWFRGYRFGFELLILNGLLTFIGLCLIAKRNIKLE
ncbi:MAG: sodium:solute symporter [Microscillaceae bacterium]|nr:sodium:solute symporter [Microscillaceae bacterium]MDW8460213.1 sodium:solute symporter [Cytophagales bacterium]